MAVLNSTCHYAIRAAIYVAATRSEPGEFVSTRRIAKDLDVSFAFLTKVLQELTHGAILVSQRGAAGGVALARPAATISLLDILIGVGGDAVFRDCLLGLPQCSDETPCALHGRWRAQRASLGTLFSTTMLADLVDGQIPAGLPADSTGAADPTRRRTTNTRSTS